MSATHQSDKKLKTIPLKITAFTKGDLQHLLPHLKLASLMHTADLGTRDVKHPGSDVRFPLKLGKLGDHNITASDNLPIIRGCPDGWETHILGHVIRQLEKLGWSAEKFDAFVVGAAVKRSVEEKKKKERETDEKAARKATKFAKRIEKREEARGKNHLLDWNRDGRSVAQVADYVLGRLLESQVDNPRLFTLGDKSVRIAKDPETGLMHTEEITPYVLSYEIGRVVTFSMSGTEANPEERHIATPHEIVSDILHRPDSPWPVLRGIADSPFFDQDGNLVATPGYHAPSRVYYMPPTGFRLLEVPERPEQKDVRRALRILDEALWDIPFDDGDYGDGSASKANWLAKLTQPSVRQIINGACPWYVGQKPKERTGQTLLAHLHSLIAYGYRAQIQNQKKDAEEYQKTVVAELRAGTRHLFFDNLHGKLDDPTLASLATGRTYKGRLLGKSEMVLAPINCELEVNGNNIGLSDELRERSVLINLNAKVECPADRAGWRYPRLLDTVEKSRPLFLWAILILVRSWIVAGSPQWQGKPMGGFEAACGVLGGILSHAGVEGFLGNREALRDALGDDGGQVAAYVALWWKLFGDKHVNVGLLGHHADPSDYGDQPPSGTPKVVETLCDLMMLYSGRVDLGFNHWRTGAWCRGMGGAVEKMKNQMFKIDAETTVAVKRSGTGNDTQGWRLVKVPV